MGVKGVIEKMDDTFRLEFTLLDEEQKTQMNELKLDGQKLLDKFNLIVPKDERSERSRCMAIARTNLEIGVMMAVKAVTTKKEQT